VPVQDTLRDACGYDSVLVTYKPVLLNGPFSDTRKADTIFTGQSVQIFSNGNGNITWAPDPSLSCVDCPDPIASPAITTRYTATNSLSNGCQVSDTFNVVVLTDAVVMTPTAFTPNGDGRNDYFGPIGKVPDNYKLQIFNRNGETVFKSSAMNQKWNGTFRGVLQPSGVFIYVIEYKDIQNKTHQQKGTFTLIR
jgi:gliding motility-associated-like protein